MKKNNKKGFTLVELVIVVAVMAVLVAVAIPTISSITGEAKDAVAESNARTIESIIKLAEADADGAALTTQTIAKAVYDAKLGIADDDAAATGEPTFYYNPANGTVVAEMEDGATAGTAGKYCSIAFDVNGGITISGMPGVNTDKGGTYKMNNATPPVLTWTAAS